MDIKVIVPTYQSAKWLPICIQKLIDQTYSNFQCVFIDDCSTDNSADVIQDQIKNDNRFSLLRNDKRSGSSLGNYIKGFDWLNPNDEDIICWIDGDDWLVDESVLQKIYNIYQTTNCWMTYGSWQVYPTGEILNWNQRIIPEHIHQQNKYRDIPHLTTHFRTHKAFLFRKIDRQDLRDPIDSNEYCLFANDTCYLYPMLEMCGSSDRIYLVKEVLYVLNRENPINEHKVDAGRQYKTMRLIQQKHRYARL